MAVRLSENVESEELEAEVKPFILDLGCNYGVAVESINLTLSMAPEGEGHRLIGSFPYRILAPCSRCLETVHLKGAAAFNVLYLPASQTGLEEMTVSSKSQYEIAYCKDDTIVLQDLVRQELHLELPAKILCRENCKGLCPRCGANLNDVICACPKQDEDGSLSALSPTLSFKLGDKTCLTRDDAIPSLAEIKDAPATLLRR